ncbi:MAG: D-glycerate dehydrogenase [Flavobacteriales bacterium CG_4_9_14_3_um_filter_40_17]|nr:MAG: D-glycerate dehydrogenase [Flavobacteriales bacterium CG_4_9_14_3_um_filter_40_17]
MAPKKIFVSNSFPPVGIEMLKKDGFSVTIWNKDGPITQDELIENSKAHHVLFCSSKDKIDKRFLNECAHLEMISQFAAGYDNIEVAEATRLGIPIGYTPNAMNEATADVAFGLMIATARKMFYLHKKISKGEWEHFNPTAHLGMELRNKTLGIFGLGRIGMQMAKRCQGAYDMKIIYHNRKPLQKPLKELDLTYVDFKTLLSESDVISVHCPLISDTIEVFDKTAFSQMKPTAIFINTARGLVHNEQDLTEALLNGTIWGAGLDVTNPEPMQPDNPLLQMENVSVLPHIGSATFEARAEMSKLAAENILGFYKNKRIPHLINPEVFNH